MPSATCRECSISSADGGIAEERFREDLGHSSATVAGIIPMMCGGVVLLTVVFGMPAWQARLRADIATTAGEDQHTGEHPTRHPDAWLTTCATTYEGTLRTPAP